MTNLARTQGDWNALGREGALFLAPVKLLKDVGRKFNSRRGRIQIVEQLDVNGFTSLWALAGVVIGTNADEDGKLFVRIADETPGAGQARVSLYKAAGGGGADLVAQGSGADGTTITLAAQNASGITGTVKIGTVTASESNDQHTLLVFPDFSVRMNSTFNGSQPEHGALQKAYLAAMDASLQAVATAAAAWSTAFELFCRTRLKNFQKSAQTSPISKDARPDQGTIKTTYVGLLEDTRKNMLDELTAGAQTVQRTSVAAAAGVEDSQNQGHGTITATTLEEWADDGLVTLTCSSDTIGSEQFAVSQYLSATGDTVTARNPLQVGRVFADPDLGIRSMLLTRTLAFTAGSANDVGVAASWTIAGEKSANTANGLLYLKVIASGGGSVTSKIVIGAGAGATTFSYSYKGTTRGIVIGGGGPYTAAYVATQLNNDVNFSPVLLAADDGAGKLVISMKLTADGEYARIESGTFNGQGGAGQDTFNNGTVINKCRIDGYSSSLYTSTTQVFTSTTAQASGAITLSAINSSGMTGSGVIGSQPTHLNTATLSLQTFQVKNAAAGVPDKFTVAITLTSFGEFQQILNDLFGYSLNSAVSNPTITDKYVSAGTFVPYEVKDA